MINADCMISGRGWGGGSQGALGARDGAAGALVELDGGAQGAGHGLELGLDDVVRLPTGPLPESPRTCSAMPARGANVWKTCRVRDRTSDPPMTTCSCPGGSAVCTQ